MTNTSSQTIDSKVSSAQSRFVDTWIAIGSVLFLGALPAHSKSERIVSGAIDFAVAVLLLFGLLRMTGRRVSRGWTYLLYVCFGALFGNYLYIILRP